MNSRKKILLVNDNDKNLSSWNNLISQFNVTIIAVKSGNEAISVSLIHEFALAIMEFHLPDMDCTSVVNAFRKNKKTKKLPILLISEFQPENISQIQDLETGFMDILIPPVNNQLLLGKVKFFLEIYAQNQELEKENQQRLYAEKTLKETEKNLEILKQKAEEAEKLKTTFLANMSHEVRTPMNAIIGFSNLLNNTNLTHNEREEYIEYIKNSGKSLLNIIDDLIDIAKIEAGQIKINEGPVDIIAIFKELFILFKEEINKRRKNSVTPILSLPNADSFIIKSDSQRLRQILSNLINNALKFTERGTINFGLEITENKNDIIFFIKDTGIGIPKDKIDLIFNRFEKIKDDRVTNTTGTGIGLSIVKKMIELMGGTIWVNSNIDVGTNFYLKLPLIQLETVKLKEIVSENREKADFKNKSILIAEDEYINYIFLQEALNSTMAEITWARNGKEAVEICDNKNIDLILMDIKMPIMSGYDATIEIKQKHKNIPVIAQTAYAMSGEKEMCLHAGFDEYLTKPIPPAKLISVISKLI